MADDKIKPRTATGRHYPWPWWVLGAVLVAVALAGLWMSEEIARTRMIRDLNAAAPQTNSVGR